MSEHEPVQSDLSPEQAELRLPDSRVVTLQSDTEDPLAKERAFSEIVGEFGPALNHFSARMVGSPETAEEVVQESFLAAWKNIGKFEGTSAGLKSWLYKIVRNRSLNAIRNEQHRRSFLDSGIDSYSLGMNGSSAASLIGIPEARQDFHDNIVALRDGLAETQWRVASSSLVGFSLDEIAARETISVPSAKAKLQRGRTNARRILSDEVESEDKPTEEISLAA